VNPPHLHGRVNVGLGAEVDVCVDPCAGSRFPLWLLGSACVLWGEVLVPLTPDVHRLCRQFLTTGLST